MIYILTGDIETAKSNGLLQWIKGRTDIFGILSPRNHFNERHFLDENRQESFTMEAKLKGVAVISVGRYCFFCNRHLNKRMLLLKRL